MKPRVYIYGLIDPFHKRMMYVGKAADPGLRFKAHIYDSQRLTMRPIAKWIRGLAKLGTEPDLIILASCLTHDWRKAEMQIITQHSRDGDLLNVVLRTETS